MDSYLIISTYIIDKHGITQASEIVSPTKTFFFKEAINIINDSYKERLIKCVILRVAPVIATFQS